jgi:hypothetical protein
MNGKGSREEKYEEFGRYNNMKAVKSKRMEKEWRNKL